VSAIGRARDRLVSAALGVDLRSFMAGYQQSLERLEARHEPVYLRAIADTQALRAERDGTTAAEAALAKLRASVEYRKAFAIREPLVSVRIAAYQNLEALMDVAIASVLAQTYERFEVVVVSDGPSDETREAITQLGDKRVRFENLPVHSTYPSDPYLRWMVAGSPAMNRGADLALGTWIAPLDQDDAFTPDHLEKLLAAALDANAELSYGTVTLHNVLTGVDTALWSSPPTFGHFTFQGALHLRLLSRIFRYDGESWKVGEPGDWNLMRRMLAAGVTVAAIKDVVATVYTTPPANKR
jgi:hypothetical protein